MDILRLILRNSLRHRLRTGLTAFGIAIALLAFCFIRTVIDAWYSGVESSGKNRLITRNAVSLIFYLPISYGSAIAQTPGVEKVGYANWFGALFREEKFRFAQFAVDSNYLDLYPEIVLEPSQRQAFEQDRTGAILGRDIAEKFNLKVGDVIQLTGTIFPGMWQFNISGIYDKRDDTSDTRTMYFHWDYLNERNKREIGRQPDHVGIFVLQIKNGIDPAVVSKSIDERFANSFAESLTETETAFRQSFISMSSTIIVAMNVISFVVIVIMLLVLTNTMIMSARERFREYSVLKAIGFGGKQLAVVVWGESLAITLLGFVLLGFFLIPIFGLPPRVILGELINFFPIFRLNPLNVAYCFLASIIVASLAAAIPCAQVMRLRVTEGLRRIA